MEAMASGCAVITMDTPGGNRILIQNGINGLLDPVAQILPTLDLAIQEIAKHLR